MRRTLLVVLGLVGLLNLSAPAEAGEFELGLRFNVLTGNGEPTNDVLSQGLFARFPLNERWRLGLAIDYSPEFDVERVAELVGQSQDPDEEVVDAKATSTFLSAWLERVYPNQSGRREWFWGLGLGVGEIDADDVSGPRADGGIFAVTTDAETEFVALGSAGLRWLVGESWTFEIALRVEQHFADWLLVDTVSGATAQVDDFFLKGGHFALSYRF